MKKKVRVTRAAATCSRISVFLSCRTFHQGGYCPAHCRSDQSKGLTQAKAASLLGLAQPDVSKLLRGHFAGYTYDRLFGYLNAWVRSLYRISEAKPRKTPGLSWR